MEGSLRVSNAGDLSGLSCLCAVEGILDIQSNDALVSLDGLTSLAAVKGNLSIHHNTSLPTETAKALVYDVIGEGNIGGNIDIHDNGPG